MKRKLRSLRHGVMQLTRLSLPGCTTCRLEGNGGAVHAFESLSMNVVLLFRASTQSRTVILAGVYLNRRLAFADWVAGSVLSPSRATAPFAC
jgi:hypothetical protein